MIFSSNEWESCRGTHMIVNRYLFPDFVFGIGTTQSIITLLNGSSNAGKISMGLVLYSDLVYQPFDTYDKFSQTAPHFFSMCDNRSAVGFYPQSCLPPCDHSWVNYVSIQVSLTCTLFLGTTTCPYTLHLPVAGISGCLYSLIKTPSFTK